MSAETDRLHHLTAWLRSHGVCWSCSLDFAFAQVEREHKRTAHEPFCGCIRQAPPETCRAIGRRVWPQLPPNSVTGVTKVETQQEQVT